MWPYLLLNVKSTYHFAEFTVCDDYSFRPSYNPAGLPRSILLKHGNTGEKYTHTDDYINCKALPKFTLPILLCDNHIVRKM